MKITRVSPSTGIERTWDINVTEEQVKAWEDGMLIQNAMPYLSDEEREFLMTGMTSWEWDNLFLEEDDEFPDDDEPAF